MPRANPERTCDERRIDRRRARPLCVDSMFAAAAAMVTACAQSIAPAPLSDWRSTDAEGRIAIARRVVDERTLNGMSSDEILGLLGEPTFATEFPRHDDTLVAAPISYRSESSGRARKWTFEIDAGGLLTKGHALRVDFDRDGHVSETALDEE